jgi:hypothetical protein
VTGYADFLARKAQLANAGGFPPDHLPPGTCFPFQEALDRLGGTPGPGGDCSPTAGWARHRWHSRGPSRCTEHTGRPVLFLTPLAVGFQIVAEAGKFGHDAALSRDGKVTAPITVTNYEQLPKFDPAEFAGVVCDESSAIKSFDGVTRARSPSSCAASPTGCWHRHGRPERLDRVGHLVGGAGRVGAHGHADEVLHEQEPQTTSPGGVG